ncbi:MAG: Ig-like domain-containing protein [Eubacterium sp.]
MKKGKKILSVFLSIVLLITSCCVSFFAFAVDDLTEGYDFQIYYYNENNEFVEVTDQVQVMEQYDIQLYACLVYDDGTIWDMTTSGMPVGMENYSLEWHSDARYLAFCEDNDGKIHGYDATKGEAIRNWLHNEVGTIPVVGSTLESTLLALFDNDITDIDDLDTEDVIEIVNKALESMGLQDYEESLDASIAEYLNKFDVGITCYLKDENGNSVAQDTVRVLVLKSDKLLSDVVPNAAFIKNYDSIPTTVAVGYEMDLEGIITPVRTHYACEWTVTGQLGVLGSDLATVDENGHFTAISEGTVQVKVSPDINGLTAKLTEAFNALAKAGDLVDSESIAKAILLILGIESGSDNYTTLVSIISTILESGVTVDGVLTFTQDVIAPLANFILYVIYQDSITIKIVAPDAIPITSYELAGNFSVKEGESSALSFTNIKPDGAVAHDYKLTIENEEYAVMTDELTFLGIDGSTWNNNFITSNNTKLLCEMDGITNSYDISVWGKDNTDIVYIKINCDDYLDVDVPTDVNAVTYPRRLNSSLSYGWEYSDGSYVFATADNPAYTEDGLSYVTADGIMYATGCTVNKIVVKDAGGATATKQIMSGIQTTGVEFTKKHFWTKCDSGVISTGIRGAVCEVSANILPADASFNSLTFESADTESVIISASPLTTTQYTSAALTEARRAKYKTATVQCDENGYAVVYAYAIGNTSCYADITVTTQTGGYTDSATVAFANISVTDVVISSQEDDTYLINDNYYEVTAGDQLHFTADVVMSESGSWKNQGFEDVDWSVSDGSLATVSSSGIFTSRDVGTVTVTATSVFGEIDGTVTVKILPNYEDLKAAMAECDYDNLDPYDWSVESWNVFDAYYQEAVIKLSDNSFVSQKEVDDLTADIISSFEALVRYIPIERLELNCIDDADGNGYATISVNVLSNYTNYSTTVNAVVYPLEAEDYTVTYTSSDPDKITVDQNGLCKPVSSSDAAYSKITVTVTDPKNGNTFTQEMWVSFAKYQVTSVSVSPDQLSFVGVGEDAQTADATISVKYNTSSSITSASIKHGFFASSDDSVAVVNSDGTVTPVGVGNCVITFTAYDGGHTAQTFVTVTTNKTNLKAAIDNADNLVEEFYTEESFAVLTASLLKAEEVYDNPSSTQQEINNITDELNQAISELVKNPYANVYIGAMEGGSVIYDGQSYVGENNSVCVLIENGLTITAAADEGYHFICWKDDDGNVLSTDQTATFNIDYSAHFTAVFEKINSIQGITLYVDGNDTDYYTVNVGILSLYTNASAKLSYGITPSNANFYSVEYKTNSSEVSVSNDGTVKPASNNTCYAIISVVATNTLTGEQFTDTVTIAFVKYAIKAVSANPDTLLFNGVNSDNQTISIQYSAANSSTTPSLKQGFFVSSDENIARVDSNGVVIPAGIGFCTVTFTSYDGGYTADILVKVYADKSALEAVISDANSIIERNYTEESYNNMLAALADANEIDSTEFASQEQVDFAVNNLQTAINNLVKLDLVEYTVNIEGKGSVRFGDSVISDMDSFTVKNGDDISLTASPDSDYEFAGWFDSNGNLISSNADYNCIADGYFTITAKFNNLVYVDNIEMTYGGNAVDYASVNVNIVGNYTNYSADFGVNINPVNPSHYTVEYYLGSDASNLTISGSTVTPSSNNSAYGTVYVKVKDTAKGTEFIDSIMVAFSKYKVTGINADKVDLVFIGENSESQNVNINYNSSSSINNATIRRGIASVDDESIVGVSTAIGDSGEYMIISPRSIGSTTATFTAYDGGYTVNVNIKVVADKSVLSALLDEAARLNESDYTEETWSAMPAVLKYAQTIYNDEFAKQTDVDNAAEYLSSAIESLELRNVISIKFASIGNGTATVNGENISSISVERGETLKLKATSDEGYKLEAWYDENGNVISTDNEFEYTADASKTIIAKFTPLVYVERITATYDGDETDFAQINVSSFGKYTNYSASFDVNVYPSNADSYTVVGYTLETAKFLSISGSTVTPTSSNDAAYGKVVVTVRDNMSGKLYTDEIYVAFAKVQVKSVSVSPTSMTFAGRSAEPQTITAKYSGSTAVSNPSVKAGFFVSSDESIAAVSDTGIVTPVAPGSCTITFYSYDGGYNAATAVTVNGNVNISGKVVMMSSPKIDDGDLPVNGAKVTVNGISAVTDEYGAFTLEDLEPNSTYSATVEYKNGVTRSVTLRTSGNDKIGLVIPIIAVDYVNDGVINAKDYAAIKRSGCSDEEMMIFKNFVSTQKYSTDFYNSLEF